MESKGYSMGNIDITIIAEKPKISPHKQKILDNLYSILKTPADTINVKVGFYLFLRPPGNKLSTLRGGHCGATCS